MRTVCHSNIKMFLLQQGFLTHIFLKDPNIVVLLFFYNEFKLLSIVE